MWGTNSSHPSAAYTCHKTQSSIFDGLFLLNKLGGGGPKIVSFVLSMSYESMEQMPNINKVPEIGAKNLGPWAVTEPPMFIKH